LFCPFKCLIYTRNNICIKLSSSKRRILLYYLELFDEQMKDNISGIDGMATELYRLVTHKKTLLCINHTLNLTSLFAYYDYANIETLIFIYLMIARLTIVFLNCK
jgi:hypothetical protein